MVMQNVPDHFEGWVETNMVEWYSLLDSTPHDLLTPTDTPPPLCGKISCTGLIPKKIVEAVMSLDFHSKIAKSNFAEMSLQVIQGSFRFYATLGQRH